MKITRFLCLMAFTAILFSSCNKEVVDNPSTNNLTVDANGNISVANDADGACYAIKSRVFDNNTGGSSSDFYTAFAWFGKPNAFVDGGTVTTNSFELSNIGGLNYYFYFGIDDLFPTNTAKWVVSGNTTSGVPGFTHVDDTPFSTGGDFTLPAKVNISNPLTINFTAVNNVTAIVYGIRGSKGAKNKAVANGASSVTFSVAELNEVALPNDGIAVDIMPVVIVPKTLNGKKIYFVKQFQQARETDTL